MTTYRQTSDDLVQKLREQLGFLRTSAARFDAGEVSEATRLAMPIRVLVYDTRASHSLLGQLGVKANLRFFDTAYDIPPAEHKQVGPNQYTATARFAFPLGPGHIVGDEAGPRYEFRAPLAKHRVSALRSFDDWWTKDVTGEIPAGRRHTRRDITLAFAHQEGGAHVDPELPLDWARITRSPPLSVIVNDEPVDVPNPMPATMRQIAYEVDVTLTTGLTQFLE